MSAKTALISLGFNLTKHDVAAMGVHFKHIVISFVQQLDDISRGDIRDPPAEGVEGGSSSMDGKPET